MKKLKIVLFVIVILTLFVINAFALISPSVGTSGNEVSITGKLDEVNSNVTLIIEDKEGTKQYIDQTKTNKEGNFSFKFNLKEGSYIGKVSTEFSQYELSFKVEKGSTPGPGTGNPGGSNNPPQGQTNTEAMKERKSFKDIENHWAKNEIELLAGKGILSGMGDSMFSPEENVTRAQFATMIFNILSLEKEGYYGTFKDVKSSDWFSSAVESVAKVGVVLGSDGYFNPNNKITREEMAVIIVRAMELKGIDVLSSQVSFNDKDDISTWAVDSISKAMNKNIIKGMTETTFEPRQNATRAQASVMIYRLMELFGSI